MAWHIAPAPVGSAAASAALRAYVADIVSRYHRRPATPDEVRNGLAGSPSDDLAPPRGAFLLARAGGLGGEVAGCVGVRLPVARTAAPYAELKRLWVRSDARGTGLGRRLVEAAEEAAAGLGARALRLDTRSDLVEARRLYARLGYAEIAAYNDNPYAEHFFEKQLPPLP